VSRIKVWAYQFLPYTLREEILPGLTVDSFTKNPPKFLTANFDFFPKPPKLIPPNFIFYVNFFRRSKSQVNWKIEKINLPLPKKYIIRPSAKFNFKFNFFSYPLKYVEFDGLVDASKFLSVKIYSPKVSYFCF